MDRFQHDVVYAWRRLRRSPGFTLIAVTTLALGIGANTALFSLVNGLLLKAVPVSNLNRLAALTRNASSIGDFHLSADEFRTLESSHFSQIEKVFVSNPLVGSIAGAGQADVVSGELVSGHYFEALGVVPRAGRLLGPADDLAADAGTPIVISERLWRRSFAASSSAIGQVMRMAGYPLTIVGVAPDTFRGTWLPTMLAADVWVPVTAAAHVRTVQGAQPVGSRGPSGRTFVLLRPGVSLAQLTSVVAPINDPARPSGPSKQLSAVPADRAMLFEDFAKPGLLLGSAVLALSGLVFLIACANLTNLLLARGASRTGEVAIRMATGATRDRIFRLLLTETCLLVMLAGLVGMAVAYGSTVVMAAVPIPAIGGIVIRFDPSPDLRVFGYAFAIAMTSALAVGVIPAWRAAGVDPLRLLVSGGASAGSTVRGHSMRTWLVASQMGMSIVLLLGAGLYTRSALQAARFDPGYDTASSAMASVDFRMNKYDETRGRRILERLLDAARQMPGVQSAALASALPAAGPGETTIDLLGEGQPLRPNGYGWFGRFARVSPGLFQTLRIPIHRGRDFTDADGVGALPVVIVSEAAAAKLWPGQDALGKRLTTQKGGPLLEVVGVVADTATSLLGDRTMPFLYMPIDQHYLDRISVVIRTTASPAAALERLQQALHAVDPDLAVFDTRTVADTIGLLLTPIRVTALVLGSLAALGFAIAVLGLYGVVSYVVSQRTREFGIRRALGATSPQLYAVVLRQGLRMLLFGVASGVVVAFVGAGYLRYVSYGIEPHDPLTFIALPLSLVVAGLAASYVPARRATRIEPSVALRDL